MRSIRGKGKLSFGHALLMSVKSMQSRHLPFDFFDKYDVGQPFRILHLSNCSRLEEFADLLVDPFLPFLSEAPPFMLDWLKGRFDVQPMCDHCGVNSSHVRLLPCEDVFVLSQEIGEGVSEVLRNFGSDVCEVFRVVIQRYRF